MILRVFSVFAVVWLLLSQAGSAQPLRVFAAASLGPTLEQVGTLFTDATGHSVQVSAAGSSALARQIALGAPADVFVSANAAWMDRLQEQQHIRAETRADIAANRLVLIANAASAPTGPVDPAALAQLVGQDRLALALVDAVPAGLYARAALTALDQWQVLGPRAVQADNVRAALALVALGAARYGIVYETDAQAEPRVRVLHRFATDLHPPITYPAAVTRASATPEVAAAFVAFLQGPRARNLLTAQGFAVPSEP